MTDATGHLPYWTLEQLAEGELSHADRSLAEVHLRSCCQCSAELESARALIAALASLPPVEPSARFADAVMAHVQVAPQGATAPSAVRARVHRWLSRSRRGWMGLLALLALPAASLLALAAWMAITPEVSAGEVVRRGQGWFSDALWGALVEFAELMVRIGIMQKLVDAAELWPAGGSAVLVGLAVTVPASIWLMARLLRTPMRGGMTHAH